MIRIHVSKLHLTILFCCKDRKIRFLIEDMPVIGDEELEALGALKKVVEDRLGKLLNAICDELKDLVGSDVAKRYQELRNTRCNRLEEVLERVDPEASPL